MQPALAAETRLISTQPNHDANDTRRDRSIRFACLCAAISDEYRGRDTVVLDLTRITPIFDFFVITTAASARQMRAIADEVDRVLGAAGSEPISVEGLDSATWILQDYGDIVLHVFTPEARRLYDLEHLWADAATIDWQAFLNGSKRS